MPVLILVLHFLSVYFQLVKYSVPNLSVLVDLRHSLTRVQIPAWSSQPSRRAALRSEIGASGDRKHFPLHAFFVPEAS